jgi:DNA-binding MarR family transcriptional regulator
MHLVKWADTNHGFHTYELHDYMKNVATARYVIRRVQRIVEDCVRKFGLESLEQQALVQIYGSPEQRLQIGQVAERLDISSSALASRLVSNLEKAGMVQRMPSEEDRRTIWASATPKGIETLRSIVEEVHREVSYFHGKLTEEQQRTAMETFAFYVGLGIDLPATA